MRFKLSLSLSIALCALPLFAPGLSRARQDDQKVIEDFITTRGVTFETPGANRPTQQSARPNTGGGGRTSGPRPGSGGRKNPQPAEQAKKGTTGGQGAVGPAVQQTGSDPVSDPNAAKVLKASAGGKRPIGLGFTLYMKQGDNLVAADPAREFRSGDRLRLALETNTDGYLYIFHTENGRNPQMIFPHAQVDDGKNWINSHARDFVPADLSAWFEFDQTPATERLYIVLARDPLQGVPAGKDLLTFCGGPRAECYWKPSAAQWERIKEGAGAGGGGVIEGRNSQLAKLEIPPPPSLTRGIKVTKSEPAPAVVRVNGSAESDVFVTTVDLIHK